MNKLFLLLSSMYIVACSSSIQLLRRTNDDDNNNSNDNDADDNIQNRQRQLYIPPQRTHKLYGHVHMAKTAGTTLNGNMSLTFERVCGNKGFSFSAVHEQETYGEVLSKRTGGILIKDIGYEDCDWLSYEGGYKFWIRQFANWTKIKPLELHVPCRDPLSHTLSMLNHFNVSFDCNGDIGEQINNTRGIHFALKRFSMELKDFYTVKCFDFTEQFTKYYDVMDEFLERRDFVSDYVAREVNKPHNKSQECLRYDEKAQEAVERFMLENYEYYQFCNDCLGGEDDLFANIAEKKKRNDDNNESSDVVVEETTSSYATMTINNKVGVEYFKASHDDRKSLQERSLLDTSMVYYIALGAIFLAIIYAQRS